MLPAAEATIHGDTPQYEHTGGKDQIGCWAKAEDFVSWNIKVDQARHFRRRGHLFLRRARQRVHRRGRRPDAHRHVRLHRFVGDLSHRPLGTLKLDEPGVITLAVKPKAEPKWKVIGLKSITLHSIGKEP